MQNFMTLKIKAISKNEAFARSVVAAFCASLNPTVDQLSDIKTAISEAVTNSIVHGYKGKNDGIIEVNATLKGSSVHIEILDSGIGIADIETAKKPFFTTKAKDERSGMGFTVMESFMDKLEVKPRDGGGLVVSMTKNFNMNTKKAG